MWLNIIKGIFFTCFKIRNIARKRTYLQIFPLIIIVEQFYCHTKNSQKNCVTYCQYRKIKIESPTVEIFLRIIYISGLVTFSFSLQGFLKCSICKKNKCQTKLYFYCTFTNVTFTLIDSWIIMVLNSIEILNFIVEISYYKFWFCIILAVYKILAMNTSHNLMQRLQCFVMACLYHVYSYNNRYIKWATLKNV